MRSLALVGLGALASCVTQHKVTITGNRLREQQFTLTAKGEAIVVGQDDRDDGSTYTVRERIRLDQGLRVDGEQRIVRDLIKDCGVEGTPCALTELATYPMTVREFQTRHYKKPIGASIVLTVAAATGVAVGCGIKCQDGSPAKDASYVTVGIVGAIGVGFLAWMLIDCARSGGCHD